MDSNQDIIMEARLRKAVREALRGLLKNIESEPTISAIESDEAEVNVTDKALAEIRAYLFKRG